MMILNLKKQVNSFLLVSTLLFLFSLTFVSAVPPITTTQQFTNRYNIQIPQDNILRVGVFG